MDEDDAMGRDWEMRRLGDEETGGRPGETGVTGRAGGSWCLGMV